MQDTPTRDGKRLSRWFASRLGARIALTLALTACGGGTTAPHTPQVAMYGDSLTSGGLLQVKPVARMQAALPQAVLHDYSTGGTSTKDALLGGNPFQPFTTLPEHVAATHPDVVLILYGANDVIDGQVDPSFEARLRKLVAASGTHVILATQPHHPAPAVEAVLRDIDVVTKRVAADTGSALADVAAIPMGKFIDGVHPDQAYSDARAAVLAEATKKQL